MSNVKLGKRSIERLEQVHPDLQKVILKSFETMPFDVTILEGLRSKARQEELFKQGASKTMNSKHLTGHAIDMAPHPVDWEDIPRFLQMIECVLTAAKELGIKVRSGSDWNMNGDWKDEKFLDCPHFELIS